MDIENHKLAALADCVKELEDATEGTWAFIAAARKMLECAKYFPTRETVERFDPTTKGL